MTRRIGAGAALGLLLVATACGTAPTNSGAPRTQVVSSGATQHDSIAPPTALNLATPDPTVVGLHPVRWNKATAGSGTELRVEYTASGRPECAKLGRVDVTETDHSVAVTVLLGQVPGADCTGPQPMIAAPFQTVVNLKTPLGDRTVSDG